MAKYTGKVNLSNLTIYHCSLLMIILIYYRFMAGISNLSPNSCQQVSKQYTLCYDENDGTPIPFNSVAQAQQPPTNNLTPDDLINTNISTSSQTPPTQSTQSSSSQTPPTSSASAQSSTPNPTNNPGQTPVNPTPKLPVSSAANSKASSNSNTENTNNQNSNSISNSIESNTSISSSESTSLTSNLSIVDITDEKNKSVSSSKSSSNTSTSGSNPTGQIVASESFNFMPYIIVGSGVLIILLIIFFIIKKWVSDFFFKNKNVKTGLTPINNNLFETISLEANIDAPEQITDNSLLDDDYNFNDLTSQTQTQFPVEFPSKPENEAHSTMSNLLKPESDYYNLQNKNQNLDSSTYFTDIPTLGMEEDPFDLVYYAHKLGVLVCKVYCVDWNLWGETNYE
jgi:hypothetical protein